MKWRSAAVLPILAVSGLAFAACSEEDLDDIEPRDGVTEVRLDDNQFAPRVIRVEPNTEVIWTWDDGSTKHDVEGEDFASPLQSEGTFTHTFNAEGTYDYRCNLHPNMTGRVLVEEVS